MQNIQKDIFVFLANIVDIKENRNYTIQILHLNTIFEQFGYWMADPVAGASMSDTVIFREKYVQVREFAVADPGFPVGGREPRRGGVDSRGGYVSKKFMCRNERIWTLRVYQWFGLKGMGYTLAVPCQDSAMVC